MQPQTRGTILLTFTGLMGVVLIVALSVGAAFGCNAYNRYQKRADANNQVKVTAIQIRNQDQQIQVAQKQAQIKRAIAVGQKLANEQIAKRLTPLFVQYEMIQALEDIAASGQNNTVIYIPSGANGVPLVSLTGQPQIFGGASVPQK